MKKTVKIEMYLDCTTEWGVRRWNYVCTVWGDHIEVCYEYRKKVLYRASTTKIKRRRSPRLLTII